MSDGDQSSALGDGRALWGLVAQALTRLDAGRAVAEAALASPPTAVLAVGKAAGPMMSAARRRFGADIPGLLVGPAPVGVGDRGLTRLRGDHPFPSRRSVRVGRRVRAFVRALRDGDHLLVLLSGGASALMALPAHGLALGRQSDLVRALWGRGADICQINLLRRHLSRIKGGRLALAAAPARVTVWLISDVMTTPGTPVEVEVGSGPFAADPTTVADARRVLAHAGLGGHPAARWLCESPSRVDNASHLVLQDWRAALAAVTAAATGAGVNTVLHDEAVTGEAEAAAEALASAASTLAPGSVLVAGGEVTVTLPADAPPGGRCQHLAVATALALERAGTEADVLCCGTDGRDGPTEAMGAVVDAGTLARLRAAGVDPAAAVRDRSVHAALTVANALLPRRDTGHNLADLYLIRRR
ncbi:DUF4147 domain-containing protein [Haliangium sp.]|uniref:DUF4147 domain-containing protein n=1 Tax=Haliangium sp. TaxID=2663208 RepID=UPI003D0F9F44